MAGEIYVSNLGSFDYQSILQMYYQANSLPIQMLQSQESQIDSKINAYKEFESKIESFYDAFNTLTSTPVEGKTLNVVGDAVSAQITDDLKAVPGNYTVAVNQLAENDIWLSQSGKSLDEAVATADGTLQISYAGEVVATIDYDTNVDDTSKPSTLQEIVDAINSAQDKVRASLVYDGSSYYLLLMGRDTGEQNTIELQEVGNGDLLDQLQIGDDYSDSHVQTASDAEVTVFGKTLTSPDNTFTDAIPGVTFTANTVGTATIEVKNDTSEFEDALNKFIQAYNDIVDFVQKEGGKDGTLSGDTTLQMIRSSLLSRLQPLFNLGLLDVDKDTGHLSVKTDKLSELEAESPETLESAVNDVKTALYDYLLYLKSPDGPVELSIENLNNRKESIEEQIDFMKKLLNDQMETLKNQLIQLQLFQQQMAEVRAKLTATFGQVSLLPTTTNLQQ